MIFSLRTRF